jgi:hypothetical protein
MQNDRPLTALPADLAVMTGFKQGADKLRTAWLHVLLQLAMLVTLVLVVEVFGLIANFSDHIGGTGPKLINITTTYLSSIRIELGAAALFTAAVLAVGITLVIVAPRLSKSSPKDRLTAPAETRAQMRRMVP